MTGTKTAVQEVGKAKPRFQIGPFRTLSIALATLMAVLAIYPLSRVIAGLFVTREGFTLSPLGALFGIPDLWELIFNTLTIVIASSVIALILGSIMAWLNERTDARMGSMTDSLPLVPFLIPPIAGAIGWVLLLSPQAGLLNSFISKILLIFGIEIESGPFNIFNIWGLIFVYTLFQVPYAFMTVSAGLRNMDTSLEEQSRVSGAGLAKTLWKVTIPSIRPALGGAALLMLVQGLALFSIPVIIGTQANIKVISVRIVELLSFSYPPQMAEAIALSFVMILFVAIAWYVQDKILRSSRHTTLGAKGQRFERIKLKKWRPVARGVMILYGILAVVLPILALIVVTLNGYWTPNPDPSTWTLQWLFEAVFERPQSLRAIGNSILLGVVGATIGVLIAAIVSVLVLRTRFRFNRALDAGIKLPTVVSNIVIGVGMILAFAGPPFGWGGTIFILLVAYIVIYLPQASVSSDAAVSQVGKELHEASSVAGAGYGRTFRSIYFPLILPALIAGWAYLFANMAGDLTATAVLSGPSNLVVGFLLLQTYQNGSYGQLAPLAVILTLLSTVVVITVIAISNRQLRRREGKR